MAKGPSTAFAKVDLDIETIAAGSPYQRIYLARHPDPLGIGKTPSRFSDPRALPDEDRFGVLYAGSTLKVCFLEAILRDARNGQIGDYPLEEIELLRRQVAIIAPTRALRVIDLRGDGPVRMGIPSDVARGSDHSLGRRWSAAFHDHPAGVDGIIYSSRLNGEDNVAVYDRSVGALTCTGVTSLLRAPGFARVLNELKVAIV